VESVVQDLASILHGLLQRLQEYLDLMQAVVVVLLEQHHYQLQVVQAVVEQAVEAELLGLLELLTQVAVVEQVLTTEAQSLTADLVDLELSLFAT
jgi:hypothetical protein